MSLAYTELRPARTRLVPVRTVQYQLREWGDAALATAARPTLVLTHGWMDVGASYQFIVDALAALEGPTRHVARPTGAASAAAPAAAPTRSGSPTTWPTSTPSSTRSRPRRRWTWSATAWAATS